MAPMVHTTLYRLGSEDANQYTAHERPAPFEGDEIVGTRQECREAGDKEPVR